MGRIWQMGIRSGFLSIKASLNIYQALVRSVLEYGSEVWGFDLWRHGEQVQTGYGEIHFTLLSYD